MKASQAPRRSLSKSRKPLLYVIGVDVGGTSIRCGLVNSRGRIRRGSVTKLPVNSKGAANRILRTFVSALERPLRQAKREGLTVEGIGVGMCGPLDYEKGIVLMRGLDKYESIYGVNLKDRFRKGLRLPSAFPIYLEPDSWAFARGEAWRGQGKGYHRILAITLGTGLGSGFFADGEILTDGPGVPPPFGWIGDLPFLDGRLDDALSTRGILSLYRSSAKARPPDDLGVKEIALLARAGDPTARRVFHDFGELLGRALVPTLAQYRGDCLILGGRISLSFDLFEKPLLKELAGLPSLRKVTVARSIGDAGLRGAAQLAFLSLHRPPVCRTE